MRQSSSSSSLLQKLYLRHFSTAAATTKTDPLKHRSQAIKQAQQELTHYLHSKRALPFIYAEKISKNSTISISQVISKLPYSPTNFRYTFREFISSNPINEFGFFCESIGIDHLNIDKLLKPKQHFLEDGFTVFDAACCLAEFGFPWDKLGRFYVEQNWIFRMKPEFLRGKLDRFVSLGFDNQQIVGICLAFPDLLKEEEGGLDSELEKLIVKGKSILTCYPLQDLGEKVEFFSRLGVEKSEAGVLILSNPKILGMKKIDDCVISVSSILEHFGLCKEKLLSVEEKYKHVFGRNKMVNLPSILRATDLHEWFLHRLMGGYCELFASYDLSSPDDGLDENYAEGLKRLETTTKHFYFSSKLKFFHSIGFGENSSTLKLLTSARGSASALQERFDFLLSEGIEFSKLCKMMSQSPQVFTQEIDSLKEKINFLVEEIGLPLDYLETFPTYLMFNLEKRIKPRYKFHVWLTDQGWCTQKYTLSSIICRSDKDFLSRLSRIHPSAPQLWMEQYGNKKVDG